MKKIITTAITLGAAALLQAETPKLSSDDWAVFSNATKEKISYQNFIEEIANADIIVVGEYHDNGLGHEIEAQIAKDIIAIEPKTSIALEMFERDEQPLVDLYLDGKISAKNLETLTDSSSWGNKNNSWEMWYQPIVDIAKDNHANGANLKAANAPRHFVKLARLEGFEVLEAESAEQALAVIAHNAPCDAAILDVMLPGMNGFSLCETIRTKDTAIGIIILSAKSQESDKIKGLSIGADDYMTKPFSVSELLARVSALCRRVNRAEAAPQEVTEKLISGEICLDETSRMLLKNGEQIDLTQVEFQIMELFFKNPGVALVRDKILKGVWGENYYGDVKIVDVNIRRLRMKIEEEPSTPKYLLTVWGYGYRWNDAIN